ncbi:MAG: SH3 domain-containing protein [Candidatus Omnitrophota bacterium]|nr:SH3 domain-containing protein [Candidatus Omnitrophota bacterium]MDZ4243186.1 SH3 domain-containing protein [Candidatus Omnitrophota bacterium]
MSRPAAARMAFLSGVLSASLALSSCAGKAASPYLPAPTELPSTTRQMKTPGFWISRHPFPERVIMNDEEISHFNRHVREDLRLTRDVSLFPDTVTAAEVVQDVERTLEEFRARGLYRRDGVRAGTKFFEELRGRMVGRLPPQIPVRFGFVSRFADHRLLPTPEGLYEKSDDIDFDELQNSGLDVGTPVAILLESADGRWFYVETSLTSGWVEKSLVALCSRDQLRRYSKAEEFVVVIHAKADIFLNPQMADYYEYTRMGRRYPVKKISDDKVEIEVPWRREDGSVEFRSGYIPASDVHQGFLTYTSRNILVQAFELLNEPYGWGGMYGEQDCSRFLQMVFATVGVTLPRNSKDQARTGSLAAKFDETAADAEKLAVLSRDAAGGITLLPMKGHIMLYLGMVDGRPYAIHSVWAYRESKGAGDIVRVINRVAVTDLFLGEGSKKGSLLRRLNAVTVVDTK